MKEKYSCYEFEVRKKVLDNPRGVRGEFCKLVWVYKIYGTDCLPYDDGVIESDEWFDTENEARFAAIGHISLLENGEG